MNPKCFPECVAALAPHSGESAAIPRVSVVSYSKSLKHHN